MQARQANEGETRSTRLCRSNRLFSRSPPVAHLEVVEPIKCQELRRTGTSALEGVSRPYFSPTKPATHPVTADREAFSASAELLLLHSGF